MSIDTELRNEFQTFKNEVLAELHTLSKQQSSRRGLDGARGCTGSTGAPGRDGKDATVKIIHENGKVLVLGSNGERAEIVAVPGA